MKSNELRIGNYIKRKGIVVQVDEQTFLDIKNNPNEYEPIELTVEWLVKFGFELAIGSKTIYFLQNDNIELCLKLNSYYSVIIDSQYRFPFKNIIQYVHQLQNLYFALTSQELELKH